MTDVILHAHTSQSIDDLIESPVHAVLISGPAGTGKSYVADHIAARLLDVEPSTLHQYPYYKAISPGDDATTQSISIESVRELQKFLTLKTPGSKAVGRILLIKNAQMLTIEAQNALLKTLEEPPVDTVVLLTATAKDLLLPTIQSRVRHIPILPPEVSRATQFFVSQGYETAAINKAASLSGGLISLTEALLAGNDSHRLVLATSHARGILQSKLYERLLLTDNLSKQKDLMTDILYVLSLMARMSLAQSTEPAAVRRWQRVARAVYDTQQQLSRSAQAKLVLTNLMMAL